MKTKAQKTEQIKQAEQLLAKSRLLVFADFTGLSVAGFQKLKKSLKTSLNIFQVVKKRLLKIAFKNQGIEFDPVQFESQVATLFSAEDLTDIAAPIYKFSKETKNVFKILGAYDLNDKKFFSADEVKFIGQLPPREVLLAQLVSMISSPLRQFLFVLNEKAKRSQ
ncbi:MAG: 50S ribosomal protein L10 [Candidatus Brennerbacteria bacterium]|nr:50S ribosomal protein L10 [Candidatus Brennerbacteria bacterium]